jgi:hypothetical protein
VKHIALPARCVNSDKAYTATGLGDRIHSAIIGWVYGQAHQTPVTLHLTAEMWRGGQFGNKPESWAEIIGLFPAGHLSVCPHSVSPKSQVEWLAYLREYDPISYWYGDYPGLKEIPRPVDIAPYFECIPPLQAEAQDIDLPERFITMQWDSNAASRRVGQRQALIAKYQADGFDTVTAGGEASDPRFRWSLKHIAYAISKAAIHVGVDSAFFHLAQLYLPWQRIHLYKRPDLSGSHHVRRARDNGALINPYL